MSALNPNIPSTELSRLMTDAAGLMAADRATGRGGDLIIQLDGQEIKDFSDLNSYLVFNTKPGQTIEVTVARNGELIVLPLTLGARP